MKHGKHVISQFPPVGRWIKEAERLLDVVKSTGLTYMMAETSYYQQKTISARKFYQEGSLGIFITVNRNINSCRSGRPLWKMVNHTAVWYCPHALSHALHSTSHQCNRRAFNRSGLSWLG